MMAVSRETGKPYSMLNQLMLSPNFDGSLASINNSEFATFNQIKKEGGTVNKGAKAYRVVFWTPLHIKEVNDDGVEEIRTIPYLKYYNVFDIKDTNLAPKRTRERKKFAEPSEEAEHILKNYWTTEGIDVRIEMSDKAYYHPSSDKIVLPKMEQYEETAEYYSTAFHESVHSTGHAKRLNRISSSASFGGETYSKEELVAEIGASALVSICGLETDSSLRNNIAYIQNWRNAIAKDNKLVISAAGKAEKAVDRILNPVGIKGEKTN